MTPFLVVLSSPSGGGKSTIARHLLERRADLGYSVSATTRPPRRGEVDGAHYHFLSRDEFTRREANGEFLEAAEYGGERYGTLRSEVANALSAGRSVVLDVEVEGARLVRKAYPDAVMIFILPPSGAALLERLRGRKSEDGAALRRRLDHAAAELERVGEYDYIVVNDDLASAVDRVAGIVESEGRRTRRQDGIATLVAKLRAELDTLRTQQVAG